MTKCSVGCLVIAVLSFAAQAQQQKCAFISSYFPGYPWSDGILLGVESVLKEQCELRSFHMDTKRNPSTEFGQKKALEAKAFIEAYQPDVVIAADDNASRYLVVPHYKDAALPFVFCGINWSVAEYGYPFSNVTGMVEVTPVDKVKQVFNLVVGNPKKGMMLSGNNFSDRKDFAGFSQVFKADGIELKAAFVANMEEWVAAYKKAQTLDFLILHNNTNIKGWDSSRALAVQQEISKTFSLTLNRWMMPFTMLGVFKIPEEQGEWAAQVALEILAGAKPIEIPIVPNSRWDMMFNEQRLELAGIELPISLLHEAAEYVCEPNDGC